MIEAHARAAQIQFGKSSQAVTVPVTTLKELCERHAPPVFDFLKVDVEGAEQDVLRGGDWHSYRPKVLVIEALAPFTLAPAWPAWEPFVGSHGYRYVWFDSLNRYYLAEEAGDLASCFDDAPNVFPDAIQFRNIKRALADESHPDHRLATILADADMVRLPLLGRDVLLELLSAQIATAALDAPAGADDIDRAIERLFGPEPALSRAMLKLPPAPRLRDVYAALLDSDEFRTACGRISASYAW
jgi:hypothetical protein